MVVAVAVAAIMAVAVIAEIGTEEGSAHPTRTSASLSRRTRGLCTLGSSPLRGSNQVGDAHEGVRMGV